MAQRLIVPVDGSAAAWRAADVAISLARRIDATVRIVEVAFARLDVESARVRLEAGVAERTPTDVEIETDVVLNAHSVAAAIDELVGAHPGDVVVMASHGRGRSAAIVGSVAEDILQRMFGPVMLIGPHNEVDDFSGPVVVSVDGSDESESALPLAASWAIELGVEPWVVHVVKPNAAAAAAGVLDSAYPAGLAHDLATKSGHRVEFDELHDDHPIDAVTQYAQRLGASLIVASSHGRSGLSRLTMGSVTAGFVRHASCPVLVVRLPHASRESSDHTDDHEDASAH